MTVDEYSHSRSPFFWHLLKPYFETESNLNAIGFAAENGELL